MKVWLVYYLDNYGIIRVDSIYNTLKAAKFCAEDLELRGYDDVYIDEDWVVMEEPNN